MALEIEGSNPSVHPKLPFPAAEAQLTEDSIEEATPPHKEQPAPPAPVPVAAPTKPRSRPLRWLAYAVLAILPALVVGLAVYFFKGGSSGNDGQAAAVIDGFLRLGQGSDQQILTFEGETPEGFPEEFPVLEGGDAVVSFHLFDEGGASYFVILSANATPDEVLDFYLAALNEDPWQVEIASASTDFTGLRFTRPDNAEVQGDVTIRGSETDGRTTVYVTFQDISLSARATPDAGPFVLGPSRPLPSGFPADVPLYESTAGEVTVTETFFQRDPGGTIFVISLLTEDGQREVIDFYETEFERLGWTFSVSDTPINEFVVGVDFSDGPGDELSGSVFADSFADEPTFTKVDIQVRVSGGRGRGN